MLETLRGILYTGEDDEAADVTFDIIGEEIVVNAETRRTVTNTRGITNLFMSRSEIMRTI